MVSSRIQMMYFDYVYFRYDRRAKAMPQTYRNHEASHLNCQKHFMYDETSSWLMVNPVFHISGLSICSEQSLLDVL